VEIRNANTSDCRPIAELALIAGEGIPAYFWAQSQNADQDLFDTGARNAASESENFSYRNVRLAVIDNRIAGMSLAYPLPDSVSPENLHDYPEFIRPLIELEHCAPGSFYLNMLATYPEYRNQSIGARLMQDVETQAANAGRSLISIVVFGQNEAALRFYRRLGYTETERRPVIAHACHPYTGDALLLTKTIRVNS
jgi:ribosomal protein S18 acetylase RimI-like enzyme